MRLISIPRRSALRSDLMGPGSQHLQGKLSGYDCKHACSADPAHGPPELNKEVLATIEKLKKAAEKHPAPAASSYAAKQIPSSLKPPLKAFALAVMRQTEKDKEALRLATQAVMPFMEPYVSRPNLMVCNLESGAQAHKLDTLSSRYFFELKHSSAVLQ